MSAFKTIGSDDYFSAGSLTTEKPNLNNFKSEDVKLFEQEMYLAPVDEAPIAGVVADKFNGYAGQLDLAKADYDKKITKVTKTGNVDDFTDAIRAMQDYHLQVNLTMKVVSKCSQALEKITNMQ